MTGRKHTPIHGFWYSRVEGQIRDAIGFAHRRRLAHRFGRAPIESLG
jgi:hypothetical protein